MRFLVSVLIALLLVLPVTAETVVGTVYHDVNANFIVDANEPGIPDVAVSNGEAVVMTDSAGRYTLDVTDPGIVFVVKPGNWKVLQDPDTGVRNFYYPHRPQGSPKLKFGGIPATGVLPGEINFPLQPQPVEGPVRMLVLGDTQVRDFDEVRYFLRDLVTEITGLDVAFGCVLGDVVFNNPRMFAPLRQAAAQAGLNWHFVPGNHDADFDAPSLDYTYETFQRELGPSYYAAAYGNTHILVLNDIRYELPSEDYHAELGKQQQAFVRNYLANVPKDAFIILLMHIPIMRIEDKVELFETIADFPNCISLSAHTHDHAHYFLDAGEGWPGTKPHHHIVQGTACGSWYRGFPNAVGIPEAVMSDGTPKGYSILTIGGSVYDLAYHPSNRPNTYQMDVHAPERVTITSEERGEVVVNFFNGTERCQVEMRCNEGVWVPMERFTGKAPYYVELTERQNRFVKLVAEGRGIDQLDDKTIRRIDNQFRPAIGRGMPGPSDTGHLWRAPVPAELQTGFNRIDIRATTMFGRTHEAKGYIYGE